MTSTQKCRKNGWTVGTWIKGYEGDSWVIIEITAIGRETVLACIVDRYCAEDPRREHGNREWTWDLFGRQWRKVR